MNTLQHITTSRLIAFAMFAMVLVLTPRAWVEETSTTHDAVPVQTLEPQADDYCLWCQPPSVKDCKETPSKPRTWLNPDESIGSIELPCIDLGTDLNDSDPSS